MLQYAPPIVRWFAKYECKYHFSPSEEGPTGQLVSFIGLRGRKFLGTLSFIGILFTVSLKFWDLADCDKKLRPVPMHEGFENPYDLLEYQTCG